MNNAPSAFRQEGTRKPNLDKLSEDQESLITIVLKTYLDQNVGNSPNIEFFPVPLDYVLEQSRFLDPGMFMRLSCPDIRAKLLSNNQNFEFKDDEFHLKPRVADLLRHVNFASGDDCFKVEGSDMIANEETEDPDAPPVDIIKEVIEEYKALQMNEDHHRKFPFLMFLATSPTY